MTEGSGEIVHVSDTALMVAACRGLENDRADGLVRDPFAARLAGERGLTIARGLPLLPMMCFGVGIRSRFLDDLLMDAVQTHKIEAVLSLGAGLDSRPWRLNLPKKLRWIEADFPAMLNYKSQIMSGVAPQCELEQVPADLTDAEERRSVFDRTENAPALMITEGLLMYLPERTVEAIAAESAQEHCIRGWLMDIVSKAFSRRVRVDAFQSVENVRAADSLDGEQIFDVVTRAGWIPRQRRDYLMDAYLASPERAIELSRLQGQGAPAAPTLPVEDISGVHLFGRG